MKITAVSGYGDVPAAPAFAAWASLIAVTGFIFWATLHPPRLPRF